MKGKTDFTELDALGDDAIARAVAADPEAAPLDTDWTQARLVLPPEERAGHSASRPRCRRLVSQVR
jgi:hypothetical protein